MDAIARDSGKLSEKQRMKNRGGFAERMSDWKAATPVQEPIHSRTAVILIRTHTQTPTSPYGDAIKKRHYLRIFTHFWQARRAGDGEREGVGAQTKATLTSSAPEWCLNSVGICRGTPWEKNRKKKKTHEKKQQNRARNKWHPQWRELQIITFLHNTFCLLVCYSIFLDSKSTFM